MVDSIKLFESSEVIFNTNGLGALPDAISCQVGEVLNGEFEMEMEYPVNGLRYSELLLRRIIFAKSEPDSTGQPFRIYAISKPINGIVTINAHHISYDLSGYPVKPFTAPDIQTALTRLKSYSAEPHPFTFTSDKNITSPINIKKPVSTRVALGGMEGSLLDIYRGEYEFDKFSVKLHTKRGADRGVSIRYGKNLTDIKQDENCSNVYTGVYPYWFSEEEGLVELSEKILLTPGTFNYVKMLALDFTEKFQEMPTQAELRTVAESYISSHNIGVPDVSIDVQFEPLMQSNEYADFAILETVKLGDTVTVGFPEMGIQASAKCVKTIFNVITSKYETLSLGSIKSNLASTIAGQSQAISEKPSAQIIDVIKAAVFEKVSIEQLDALDVRITNLVVDSIQAANVKIAQLEADYAALDAVVANTIDTVDLNTTNLEAMNAIIQELNVTYATIASLNALKIIVETLEGEYGEFNILVTNKLNAHDGTFETILTNEAIAELITTGKLIAGSTIFADGAIGSAQIQDLDVAKLNGGIISTAKFIVQGSDGKFKIQDNRLQVFDNALIPFERVALGDIYGDGSVYALRVRGADGETVLFNEDGQTKEGFTDGYDKLEPNSLDPKNIDINRVIVRVNEDGTETIKGSKVVVGNDNLEVKFTTIDTSMGDNLNSAKAYADTKAGEAQTAAESYAKTKAEAERVLAESYADGIVDDEEQARITDANAKLAAAKTHAETKATSAENAAKTYADLKKTEAIDDSNNYTDGKIAPINSTITTQNTQITALQGQIALKVEQTDITQAIAPINTQLDELDEQIDGQSTTMLHMGAELTLLKDNISMSVSELEIQTSGLADKTSLLEGDLENFQNEYDDSISDIDTRILSQSAEIDVLSTGISSKVSKTEYDEGLGEVNQNYVELKQGYDDLKLIIQDGGGSNIIKNSVGYGSQNFWTIESGTINPGQSTWILDGASKHGWLISAGTMCQSLDLLPNTEYTISGRLLKATQAGTVMIGLYDVETDALINTVISKDTEVFDGKFSLQFSSLNTKQYNLRISVAGASTVNPVEITDLMLAQGLNYDIWNQANGEIYTLNVRMDGKGINVYSADGMGKTIMSPEEFAGYYNNQKIFTLNGDITEVMGLYVGGKGLFIPPVKFVQTQNSLDVVWTGR